jgi:hypothetical protein
MTSESGSRRDSQKSKVYAAERAAKIAEEPWTIRRNGNAMTIAECQALVDKMAASAFVQRHYDLAQYGARVIPGRNGGWASGRTISLGVWARQPAIVMHEFAHVLVGDRPWHGWKFCECFLTLVRHFMGADEAARLEAAFKAHGVKYRAPRKVTPLSPERRAAAIANLAAARKAPAVDRPTFTTPDDAPYHSHMCETCDLRLPATKFPTTRNPGEREGICRDCRDAKRLADRTAARRKNSLTSAP